MLDGWFRPLELPIPFAEFVRLPRHPAYKYEYFDGRAVLTPRPHYQRALLDLAVLSRPAPTRSLPAEADIRPLHAEDWAGLPELLAAAFHHVPPFAALSEDLRLRAAAECLERTRAGDDGPVVEPACFLAEHAGRADQVDGVVLITLMAAGGSSPEGVGRPHLTWIAVHPWRLGRGLGTALLTSAATALRGLGYVELASTFLVGNERSALWHWRQGFRLLPDPGYALGSPGPEKSTTNK